MSNKVENFSIKTLPPFQKEQPSNIFSDMFSEMSPWSNITFEEEL